MKKLILPTLILAMLAHQSHANASPPIELHGLIEIEAFSSQGESDISLASSEINLLSAPQESLLAEITLKSEGDDFFVENAVITISPEPDGAFYSFGKMVIPFGHFDTNMVTDPLTKELAETHETTAQFGFQNNDFSASVFIFNGSNTRVTGTEKIDNFGLQLAYTHYGDVFGLAYINDIGDSDTLQQSINQALGNNNTSDNIPGIAFTARVNLGSFTMTAEHIQATSDFVAGELASQEARPSATHFELSHPLMLAGNNSTIAVAMQESNEAAATGMVKQRLLTGLIINLLQYTTLSFEVSRETAYDDTDSHTFTLQLAYEI